MKKIIQTVADGGGELGVHMYPLKNRDIVVIVLYYLYKWVFQKVLKLDESVGWMHLNISKNSRVQIIFKLTNTAH